MTPKTTEHLREDELLKAAVDIRDLSVARREHLEACPICRQQYGRLMGRLENMGRMAAESAPQPARPFRLPAGAAPDRRTRSKAFWVAGLAAAMLLVAVMWPLRNSGPGPMDPNVLTQDRRLMTSIDVLVEDALPEPYRQLAQVDDRLALEETEAGEDFMEWIVPPPTHETADEITFS